MAHATQPRDDRSEPTLNAQPTSRPGSGPHFRRIMIAIDNTPVGARAGEIGANLARSVGAEVALVHVVDVRGMTLEDGGVPADEVLAAVERGDRELLADVAQRLGLASPPWQFIGRGEPAKEVVAAATQWGADLIVVGTHARRGVPRLMLGSTAEGILRHAHCPVLVVPPGPGMTG